MSDMVARIITPGSATISYQGNTKTFMAGSPEYDKVKELVKSGDNQALADFLVNFKKKVESAYSGDFRVVDDVVFVRNSDGTEDSLPRVLGERLVEFANEGLPYQPIINFWNRLQQNPSYSVVQRLFECLEHNRHPLNSDGRYLCWKKVKRVGDDLYDIYSGKFRNNPGDTPNVRRNMVDEDMDKTCSNGLHVASYEYAHKHYGSSNDIVVEVLVDPADVVAIPRDYNSQKMRVCHYEVVRECETEDTSQLYNYNPESDENENVCDDCGEIFDDCICDDDYFLEDDSDDI